MSIINQMLRDLDARGGLSTDQVVERHRVPPPKRRMEPRMVGLLVFLLASAGAIGYIVLSGALDKASPPAVLVQAEPAEVAAAPQVASPHPPVTVASPVNKDVPPVPEPPSLQMGVKQPSGLVVEPSPEKSQVAQVTPVLRAQAAPKLTMTLPAQPAGPATSNLPAVAPAVVKKMAEITPEVEAQQYYEEAQALRRAGKTEAAMGKYRLALERNPGMQGARVQLAKLMQDNGPPDAAFALLKAGFDQRPDDGLAIAAGRLLADQGRREEALSWLERGRDGLRPADHALMGALLSQTMRYEAAAKSYQRALASDPTQGGWLLGLGLALESSGRIEDAHVAYRNALERGEFKPDVVKFLRQKLGMPNF